MGQTAHRASITNITSASPAVVTTSAAHGYSTGDFVRLTDLNGRIPIPRGVDQINNSKFRIIVTDTDTFSLEDPITFNPVDTSTYPAYVTGGNCNKLETEFQYNAS